MMFRKNLLLQTSDYVASHPSEPQILPDDPNEMTGCSVVLIVLHPTSCS